MRVRKIGALILTMLLLFVAGCGGSGKSDAFPNKPITFIIPYDAGGGSDVTGRLLASLMEKDLGVSVQAVNKPGGSGVAGLQELSTKAPDGYNIMVITSSLSALKPMGRSDFSSEDFETVATVQAEAYVIAVSANSPYTTLKEFMEAAKTKSMNVGTTAIGGNNYLAAVQTQLKTGITFNLIPYGGGAAGAVADLAAGTLDATFASPTEVRAQRDAGKIRILGITSEARASSMSDIPTFKEVGYPVLWETVRVILVPKGTPADRIKVLQNALKAATEDKKFVDFMTETGSEVRYLDSQATRKMVQEQDKDYFEVLKAANLLKK